MYKVIIHQSTATSYYSLTLASIEKQHYINIYVSIADNNVFPIISKSEDGFYFNSPCEEGANLQVESSNDLFKIFNEIKKHFLDQGYKISTY